MEELDEMRQEQKKWFMIYDDEPANEQEAAEREDARRCLQQRKKVTAHLKLKVLRHGNSNLLALHINSRHADL